MSEPMATLRAAPARVPSTTAAVASAPARRRRARPGFILSMDSLALDAAPLTTTPNAQLFRARVVAPDVDGVDPDTIVVVKRAHLAYVDDAPAATSGCRTLTSDDPIRELHVAAHIAERGGHPNVVRCHGAFLQNDSTHLVMERCAGGDLFSRLEHTSDHRLPQREALDVILQVARGLQFLHLCNVAHRDVSVENVLIAQGDVYKLCDFGLSVDADVVSTATVGKAHYMAPEIVAKMPYDPIKADVWSLGILLFILLTGSPLVKLASAGAGDFTAFSVLGSRGVLELWKMDRQFSFATLDLLDGMLQIDPRDRFQNMTELLEHPALLAATARRLAAQEQNGAP